MSAGTDEYRKKKYQCPMCGGPGPISQRDFDRAFDRLAVAHEKEKRPEGTSGRALRSFTARTLLVQDAQLAAKQRELETVTSRLAEITISYEYLIDEKQRVIDEAREIIADLYAGHTFDCSPVKCANHCLLARKRAWLAANAKE